ncbi:MAG: BrnT family toxin [Microvirga sp.]
MAALEFEWDEDKTAVNFIAHKVSIPFAARASLDPGRVDIDVSRAQDGEERRKTLGRIGRRLFCVVYTRRDGVLRLISARRTNRSEERLYGNRQVQT